MAYTKIHAIKATVHKAIAYICNPSKTDASILVTSFGCSPETAHYDFKFALSKTNQSDEKKAFHIIQSFLPGEVAYVEAHQIGMEFANKLLQGKYNYVLTTHIDKGHVHNHLIFCAADNIEHKKYNDCKKTYYNIRHLSDELCQEHNLSIITPGNEHGKKHNEWDANRNNASWKSQLKLDIDD
ncbi:MAG: relaxase/mobilization nuclease domain-containing protein, partial [Lachnospiraceae bacterium]|nr:relaxase/mobilization nuclease domain-containing protein [Lachnospiraceae bacterium]